MKSFEEFVKSKFAIGNIDENETFRFHESGTEITAKGTFPPKMLKTIADKLKSFNLTTDYGIDHPRDLKLTYNAKDLYIRLKANGNKNTGDILYYYNWDDANDLWMGGYEEAVKMSDGSWSHGDSNEPMSPEEFMDCLKYDGVLSDLQYSSMIDLIKDLRVTYRAAIIGGKYHI